MDLYFWLPTLSTAFIVISAVLVGIGWVLIIRGQREAHKKMMLAGAWAAILFFIIYSSRTIIVGNTAWGGPDHLKLFYQVFLIFHIVMATVGAIFGITTLLWGYKEKYAKHRRLGRVTSMIWFFTATTGVLVYTLLYILYQGGHTKPVWEVIIGA